MSRKMRFLDKLNQSDHTKKTIEQLRKEIMNNSNRMNNHRIKLPLDLIETRREINRKSLDEQYDKYFVMCNLHKRRKSLLQKETGFSNFLRIGKVDWEK